MNKIKVLVVDDSMLFRRTIVDGISIDPDIEVVAMAADPYEARDQIIKYRPDVMTLDVEMPKMNGIEFLKRLMPQYPLATVMVSAVDNKVFEALQVGAVDFVVKSNIASSHALEAFISELIEKIKIASTASLNTKNFATTNKTPLKQADTKSPEANESQKKSTIDIIALGASTGGTEATEQVIKQLPGNLPPLLIVQHMPPVFTKMYAERLSRNSNLTIKEAETGDILKSGFAYVAPGDHHIKLLKHEDQYMIKCFQGPKVNGHMPSVDVMFKSVADYYSDNVLAVILTGMGNDGAKGMRLLHDQGAYTIAQDESTSVVYGMPRQAYELGGVDRRLPIQEIGYHITRQCLHR